MNATLDRPGERIRRRWHQRARVNYLLHVDAAAAVVAARGDDLHRRERLLLVVGDEGAPESRRRWPERAASSGSEHRRPRHVVYIYIYVVQ